jgi:hypothetical protein
VSEVESTITASSRMIMGSGPPQGAFDNMRTGHTCCPELPHATTPGHYLALICSTARLVGPPTIPPTFYSGAPGHPLDESWNVGATWQHAHQLTGGGIGPGIGAWWRRVAVGEAYTGPVQVVPEAGEGIDAWLWEFDCPTDPSGAFTVLSSGDYGGVYWPSATLGSALSGFILGAMAVGLVTTVPTTLTGTTGTEVQNVNAWNAPTTTYPYAPHYTWIATHAAGGPLAMDIDTSGVGYGVVGVAMELPGVTSVPTIPYPVNQVTGVPGPAPISLGGHVTYAAEMAGGR